MFIQQTMLMFNKINKIIKLLSIKIKKILFIFHVYKYFNIINTTAKGMGTKVLKHQKMAEKLF